MVFICLVVGTCGVALVKRQAENFHVVVGMTRLIKMPSYWFGDVLAVVFHIQKMFAETISQPSSCFADVKLHQGNTESRKCTEQRLIFKIGTLSPAGINERFSFS